MKIGYFITFFPYKDLLDDVNYYKRYTHAGAETAAYYLALNMAKKGHEVNVFTTSINSKDALEKHENVNIYRYGTNLKIEKSNISLKLFIEPLKHELEIVHAHSPAIPSSDLPGLRYAKKKKMPLIITYHGDTLETFGSFIRRVGVSFYNKYLLEKVLSYAKVIISPSEYYINESRFLGKYRDKIVTIPNGINIEDFDIPYSKEECREKLDLSANENIILFVGNLIDYKGPDILVKAMPEILKSIPNVKLVFVGSGRLRGELEELSKRVDVEKHVKFAGFVKESLKSLYYKASDVFVLPSTMSSESFGIVNLEAMACGIPIVASKIGGIPDVVKESETGLLVPPKNPYVLADAIIYLLENEGVRNKMSKNARKSVEDYSWGKITEETEKIYKEVINL